MIPLRRKLVSINIIILLLAIASFGTTTYQGLIGLANQFAGLNLERSNSVKESYRKISNENIQKIKTIYEQNLRTKGMQLLSKDSNSMAPMIADNSFIGVATFLQKTFEDDRDIVLASYFTADSKDIRAWHFASSEYKHGLVSPTIYNRSNKSWKGSLKGGKTVTVSDPSILEVIKADTKSVKFQEYEINGKKQFGFDCIIPFVEGKTGPAVKAAKAKGEAVGYLRYILSPEEMNRAISAEKATLEERLKSLETENQLALKKSQEIGVESSKKVLETLGIVAALIILGGAFVSLLSATTISRPVKFLTNIAEKMAQGDYAQKIQLRSNDEIGILAGAFQNMSNAIQKRDAELADINKNLEKTIELRTLQLKEENKKISGLLNNMKQAVFAVSSDYKVVPPVSKFSDTVFKQTVEGKSIFDSIYKGIDPKSEEMGSLKSALISVYGENDLQWDLMEGSLPKRIEIKGNKSAEGQATNSGDEDRVLRVNYSALYSESQLVDKIMMVVEDITEVEKLEREIREQQQKSEILSQLTENELESVKGYFSSAGTMLNDITQILRNKSPNARMVALILRHLHTIKGNSRSLDFVRVAKVTHEVETEVESLRKYLSEPETVIVPTLELEVLRVGIAKIRSSIEKYLSVASQLFGLENDLIVKGSYEFHAKMLDASWESSIETPRLNELSTISQEIGFGELAKKFTELSAQALVNPNDASWLSILPESVYVLYKSPVFSEHSTQSGIWVSLGLKIWMVSEALEKLNASGFSAPKMTEALEKIEDAWSFASVSGMFYYAGYFRKIGAMIKTSEKGNTLPLEKNIWRQYLQTANLHASYKLQADELKKINAAIAILGKKEKFTPSSFEALKDYDFWVVSLLNTLSRYKINTQDYFARWASRTDCSPVELAKTITEKDISLGKDAGECLFSLLGQEESMAGKSFISKEDLSSEGNIYLRWLDTCQILAGINDRPEAMKSRYKTVGVLKLNLDRLKDGLVDQLHSHKVAEDTIKSVVNSIEKLMEVPVKPAMWTYNKMIDNTAKLLGKKVDLIVTGDDITLPRDTLYTLQDSMVHLIRNTIDHGIEEPAVREKANKQNNGKLIIECSQTTQSISIKVRDDGAGIDPNKLVSIAIAKGLFKKSETEKFTTVQKLEIIFMPGFSSKEIVTELSGRGVGLDVVKNNIKSLGGTVQVSTELGVGTTFEIALPKNNST